MLQHEEDGIRLFKERYQKLLTFRNEFARVYCTSGVASSENDWVLNWALAEPDPGRVKAYNNLSSVRRNPFQPITSRS